MAGGDAPPGIDVVGRVVCQPAPRKGSRPLSGRVANVQIMLGGRHGVPACARRRNLVCPFGKPVAAVGGATEPCCVPGRYDRCSGPCPVAMECGDGNAPNPCAAAGSCLNAGEPATAIFATANLFERSCAPSRDRCRLTVFFHAS